MSGLDGMPAAGSSPKNFAFSMTNLEFVSGTPHITCNLPNTASPTTSSSSTRPHTVQISSDASANDVESFEMPIIASDSIDNESALDSSLVEDERDHFEDASTVRDRTSRAKAHRSTQPVNGVHPASETDCMDWEYTNNARDYQSVPTSAIQGHEGSTVANDHFAQKLKLSQEVAQMSPQEWVFRYVHHYNFLGQGVPYKTTTTPDVSAAIALSVAGIRHVDFNSNLRDYITLGQAMLTIDPVLYLGNVNGIKNLKGQNLRNEVTSAVSVYYNGAGHWQWDVYEEDEQRPLLDCDDILRHLPGSIPIDGWSTRHGLPTRHDFYKSAEKALMKHVGKANDRYLAKRADGVQRSSLRYCQSANGEASFPTQCGKFMLAAPAPRPRVRYDGQAKTFSSGQFPNNRVIHLLDGTSKEVRAPLISKPGKMSIHIIRDQVPEQSVQPILLPSVAPRQAPKEALKEAPRETPKETLKDAPKNAPKQTLTPLPDLDKMFGHGLWEDYDEDEEVVPPQEAPLPVVAAPQADTTSSSRAKLIPKRRLGQDWSQMVLYKAPTPQPVPAQNVSSAIVVHRDSMAAPQFESVSVLEPATDAELEAEMAEDYAGVDDSNQTAEPHQIINGEGDAASDADSEESIDWSNIVDTTAAPSIPGLALVPSSPISDKGAVVPCIPGLAPVAASQVTDKETKKLAYCNSWAQDVEIYEQEQLDAEKYEPQTSFEGSSGLAAAQIVPGQQLLANAPFWPETDYQVCSSTATAADAQTEPSQGSPPADAVQASPPAVQALPPVLQETALSTRSDGTLVAKPMDKYATFLNLNEAINPCRKLSNVWRMNRAMNRQRIAAMERVLAIEAPTPVPAIEAPAQVPVIVAPAATDDVPDVEDDGVDSLFEYGPEEDPDACWRGLIKPPRHLLIFNAPCWPEQEYRCKGKVLAAQQQQEEDNKTAAAEMLARFRESSPSNDTSTGSNDTLSEPKTPDSLESWSSVERVPTISQHSASSSALLQMYKETESSGSIAESYDVDVPAQELRKSALKGFRQRDQFIDPPESVSDAESTRSISDTLREKQPGLRAGCNDTSDWLIIKEPASSPVVSAEDAVSAAPKTVIAQDTSFPPERHSPHQLEAIAEADEGPNTPSTLRDAGDHFEPSSAQSGGADGDETADRDALRIPAEGSWTKGLTRSARFTNLAPHAPASSRMSEPTTPAHQIAESPYKRPALNTPNAMLSTNTQVMLLETISQSPSSSADVPALMLGIGTIFEDDEAFDEDLAQDESFMSDLSVANDYEAEFCRQPLSGIPSFVALPEGRHDGTLRQLYTGSDLSTGTAPSTNPAALETNTGMTTLLEIEPVHENLPGSHAEALPAVKFEVLTQPQRASRTSIDKVPNGLLKPTVCIHSHIDLKKRKSSWSKVENKLQKKQPESSPGNGKKKGAGLKKALKKVKHAVAHTLNGFGLASEHGAMV